MVQALHKVVIRVVLDVVYNHTFNTDESNFNQRLPSVILSPDEGRQLEMVWDG